MESPRFQSGEARDGSAHLYARRGSGNFAGEGAFQVQEETRAAGGRQHDRRSKRRKSQLSLFTSMRYWQSRASSGSLPPLPPPLPLATLATLLHPPPPNS